MFQNVGGCPGETDQILHLYPEFFKVVFTTFTPDPIFPGLLGSIPEAHRGLFLDVPI